MLFPGNKPFPHGRYALRHRASHALPQTGKIPSEWCDPAPHNTVRHGATPCDTSQRWPRSLIGRRASTRVATTPAFATQRSPQKLAVTVHLFIPFPVYLPKAGCPRSAPRSVRPRSVRSVARSVAQSSWLSPFSPRSVPFSPFSRAKLAVPVQSSEAGCPRSVVSQSSWLSLFSPLQSPVQSAFSRGPVQSRSVPPPQSWLSPFSPPVQSPKAGCPRSVPWRVMAACSSVWRRSRERTLARGTGQHWRCKSAWGFFCSTSCVARWTKCFSEANQESQRQRVTWLN